jgi:hypothetical protein
MPGPDEEEPEEDSEDPGPARPARRGAPRPQGRSRGAQAKGVRGGEGARAAKGTRRGPGQPGSARRIPDGSPGPAGALANGHPLDTAPGGAALLGRPNMRPAPATGSLTPPRTSSLA